MTFWHVLLVIRKCYYVFAGPLYVITVVNNFVIKVQRACSTLSLQSPPFSPPLSDLNEGRRTKTICLHFVVVLLSTYFFNNFVKQVIKRGSISAGWWNAVPKKSLGGEWHSEPFHCNLTTRVCVLQ